MDPIQTLWPEFDAATLGLAEQEALTLMLAEEMKVLASGFRRIAGVDEAGRGPLAGPIVAAAVVLQRPVPGLNDSKKLREAERDRLYSVLCTEDHAVSVATLDAARIDLLGIQAANYCVMQEALEGLEQSPDCVLVDGFHVPGLSLPQIKLVKGDARSLTVAAASIIAKVTRDKLMMRYEQEYPGYGFARHKGYGTRQHLDALVRLGPCPIHRRSFAPLAPTPKQDELFETF